MIARVQTCVIVETITDYHQLDHDRLNGPLRFVRESAHLRALMTQKSCAVGMCNAKLGNHLKQYDKLGKFRCK